MGSTHAASGAAVWLSGCLIAATEGHQPGAYTLVVGTALCAFGAVLPDIDMPTSNVSRSLGPVTGLLARVTIAVGVHLHEITRTRYDRPDREGHRTITHTVLFCVLVGCVLAALGRYGSWPAVVFIAWAAATATRALLPPKRRSVSVAKVFARAARAAKWSATVSSRRTARMWRTDARLLRRAARLTYGWFVPWSLIVGAAVAGFAAWWPPPGGAWLGVAVGAGCLVHNLADALTLQGTPLLWPVPVRGQVWYPVRPRPEWRIRTGLTARRRAHLALGQRLNPRAAVRRWRVGYQLGAERVIARGCLLACVLSVIGLAWVRWPHVAAAVITALAN